ncbi:MAG: HEAT repeat domain-containing protein [Planctomycetaceae bacterium]|nr:HEAT repeat domain-containing protein [Planctomycetaceae bacterium]
MMVRRFAVFGFAFAVVAVSATLAFSASKKAPDKAAKAESSEVPMPDDPAVAAILAAKPTTPSECVRAASVLAELGHPDVARPLVKKVLDAKLDAAQLAALGEELGSAALTSLANQPALQPESRQLADAISAALAAKRQDIKRIGPWIAQLQDSNAERRLQALANLQAAGDAAIGPLVQVLADPSRTAEQANVRTVLAGMGQTAFCALVGVLEDADPKLAVQIVKTLVEMNDRKAAIYLLGAAVSDQGDPELRRAAIEAIEKLSGGVPDRDAAVTLLMKTAMEYFDGRRLVDGEVDGHVDVWRWDEQKRAALVRRLDSDDAARALAVRWSGDAYRLAPETPDLRSLSLAALLEAAAYANGLDRPLGDDDPAVAAAKRFDLKTLERALVYAMAHQRTAAATVLVGLLGQSGTAELLLNQGDRPSPLVLAVQSPDRRLRLAALEAIVRLKPEKPFPGSSTVPTALGYFAAGGAFRLALIGAPGAVEARDLAGMLAAMGVKADTAANGRELLQLAVRSPDCEMIWIDYSIQRPTVALLLQELRRDPRTAHLPIGVVTRAGFFAEAERLVAGDPRSMAFARPRDADSMRWQAQQLGTIDPREQVPLAARRREAAVALKLLEELVRSSGKLYDLRRAEEDVLVALYHPQLSPLAAAVLSRMNSSESQQALVDLASRSVLPLEMRKAAAAAFRENVERFGTRLTSRQVLEQYRRYNNSERQDAETQRLLGLILDCLEASPKHR